MASLWELGPVIFGPTEDFVSWLQNKGLLASSRTCSSCSGAVMRLGKSWLLSIGAYSFSQQENERLTANMRLIGIPLINMGGVIIILWNTAGEALNKYTIKPTAK